ncbi:30S ribosomal protein S9 [Candidatus Woesearchaeota archaeon]|nr:30S ribosomal protein S9 [Candidatus Woesearchaeota archaeon]
MKNHASGKRKRAIARVTLQPGSGKVIINDKGLAHYGNGLSRARIQEPIILGGQTAKKFDFMVRAIGGGASGQADAIRLAIGRALAQQDPKLKSTLMDYDRLLLVADVRRKEASKPNSHGKARSKRQKSYR